MKQPLFEYDDEADEITVDFGSGTRRVELYVNANEVDRLRAKNEALTSELRQRAEQIGVACHKHDLTHSLACGQCMNELRAEVEALKPLAASAQKAAEQITAMTAELHEQRDEIERLREMQGGFRHLDDLRRAMCDCADDNARLRAEVEALRLQVENYRLANGAIRPEGGK